MSTPCEDASSKRDWRARLSAARRAVPAEVRAAEARALVAKAVAITGEVICGYFPVGTEPGSVHLLDALVEAGHRVLLPVVVGPAPLDWAEYRGPADLVTGMYGLCEPAGARLGAAAIARAGTVLVPALAVDRTGVRLGRGGGHYDRSLPLCAPDAVLAAVVRDDEVVDALPVESHDVRMNAVFTPGQGLRGLGTR